MWSGWSRVAVLSAVAASLIVAAAVTAGAQGADTFGDIDEAGVHARSVEALAEAGIVEGTGCGEGRFCPDEPIDRWVMAVWLVRAVDGREPSPTSVSRFADVASGRWWVPHVERLAVLGITSGCATGPARFCPDDSVTRAQMATFLTRAFGLEAAPSAGFADTAGNVHAANIDALAAARITAGCRTAPLRYCPKGAVTRAQMATFLARALGLIPLPEVAQPTAAAGGRIAYVSYGAIYVADDDGSDEKRLTIDNSNPGDDFVGDFNLAWHDRDPAWSPDGTRIAFIRDDFRDDFSKSELFIMGSDGDNVQKVGSEDLRSPDWSASGNPSWSPDGTRIAVAGRGLRISSKWRGSFDMVDNIFVVDHDGHNVRRLTYDGGWGPSWSPDGTRIAFTKSTGVYATDIFVMDTNGHNVRRLTYGGGWGPSWSPDGTRIAFTSNEEVFVMNADGTGRRQLTYNGGSSPDWSPDGSRIAYESTHLFVNPYSDWHIYAEAESHGIIVMNLDGTGVQRIADGAGSPEWAPSPTADKPLIETPTSSPTKFSAISVGFYHSCGLRTNGTVACWGNDDLGQRSSPTGTFTTVSAGATHSCATRSNGTVACWGDNYFGEASPPRSATFTTVAAGFGHSCGIRTDGRVTCWGSNYDGQVSAPTGTFTAISAGTTHSCAIRTDGSVTCWGSDSAGQVSAPTGTFIAISAGTTHSCAIRTDGSVTCWGSDSAGQVSAPTGTFIAISAGTTRSCAIRTDGSVTCWGSDSAGRASPPTGTFLDIATHGHTCGISSDGSAACWGSNNYFGQITPPETYNR